MMNQMAVNSVTDTVPVRFLTAVSLAPVAAPGVVVVVVVAATAKRGLEPLWCDGSSDGDERCCDRRLSAELLIESG
jgi:hypothetical protein